MKDYIEDFQYTDFDGDRHVLDVAKETELCPNCKSELMEIETSSGQLVPACENQCGWLGDSI